MGECGLGGHCDCRRVCADDTSSPFETPPLAASQGEDYDALVAPGSCGIITKTKPHAEGRAQRASRSASAFNISKLLVGPWREKPITNQMLTFVNKNRTLRFAKGAVHAIHITCGDVTTSRKTAQTTFQLRRGQHEGFWSMC
jgi:hypothetical protein